ncbi:MAG TPA: PHB depolymerase family esterase [Pirellulaceae bacterium]|nr:PHB depolymerase family esterase [Pirellulaceae bacterium]
MNRLPPLVQQVVPFSSESPAEPPVALQQGAIERQSRHSTPHALFVPMHYEPKYAYPLLLWLHGAGDDERQLQRVMPLISLRNYVAISPRGTATATHRRGFDWRQDAGGIDAAESAVFDCVDLIRDRFNVHNQRVFLAGFGTGGTMAFRLGLRHPRLFAGALSLGGVFPTGQMPLARLDAVRKLPLFVAQGRDAERYSIDRSCEELRLFHTAGMSVTLRQYPCGDELTTNMLSDMDRWLMEQVTGVEHKPEPEAPPTGEFN